jgi:hypothetical protein
MAAVGPPDGRTKLRADRASMLELPESPRQLRLATAVMLPEIDLPEPLFGIHAWTGSWDTFEHILDGEMVREELPISLTVLRISKAARSDECRGPAPPRTDSGPARSRRACLPAPDTGRSTDSPPGGSAVVLRPEVALGERPAADAQREKVTSASTPTTRSSVSRPAAPRNLVAAQRGQGRVFLDQACRHHRMSHQHRRRPRQFLIRYCGIRRSTANCPCRHRPMHGKPTDRWARVGAASGGRRGVGTWERLDPMSHQTEEDLLVENSIWAYRRNIGHQPGMDLTGFDVEAADGRIGKVGEHNAQVDTGHIVVDTGLWIFGKHVLLPAGTISAVNAAERVVYVDRNRDEIRNAPEFDRHKHLGDPDYHRQISAYYDARLRSRCLSVHDGLVSAGRA